MSHNAHKTERNTLAGKIETEVGVVSQKCYQCGKCSAGCPIAYDMDFPPSMVMRLLQTESSENDNRLLTSKTIWLCVSCEMCLSRCPYEIDIPSLMDYLRQRSLAEKKNHPESKKIIAFHKAFLSSIKNTGRLYELGLTLDYKRRTMTLMQDVMLAPKMLSRGKLHIFPEKIKNTSHLKKIFKKTFKS